MIKLITFSAAPSGGGKKTTVIELLVHTNFPGQGLNLEVCVRKPLCYQLSQPGVSFGINVNN